MWFLNAKKSMSHHENNNYRLLLQNKQYSYTWLKTKTALGNDSAPGFMGWAGLGLSPKSYVDVLTPRYLSIRLHLDTGHGRGD